MPKLLSIVTICFNEKEHIVETMDSVLKQTLQDYEYLILDGESTDGTVELIKNHIVHIPDADHNIIFQSEQDKGIYDAMNKAIGLATGKWILFLNAGDSFYQDTVLEEIEEYLRDNEQDILYGDQCWKEDGNTYIRKPVGHERLPYEVSIFHQSAFVKTEVLKENLFSLQYKIAGDYASFLNLYAKGFRFHYVPIVIANFSYGGVSSTNPLISLAENRAIQKQYGYFDNWDFTKNLYYYYQKMFLMMKMILPRKLDLFLIHLKRKMKKRSGDGRTN